MNAGGPSILLCGLGSIGRRHLTNLITLGQQNLILLRTGTSPLNVDGAADFPVETDLDTALRRKPDAIIVSNPTAFHLPVALAGARAGCHLLLEKPISHDATGVDELRREIQRRRLACLVGFQFRFHHTLRQIKTWVDEGAIGRVVSAHVHWGEYLPGWHPLEDYRKGYSARADLGGGVVLTLCHPFDYLRWLFGDVESVFAVAGRLGGFELDVEDTAQITLRFVSGAIGSVYLDYVQQPPRHVLSVVGRQGTIEWNAASGTAQIYDARSRTWSESMSPEGFERNSMFLDEMSHFLKCVVREEQPICTLDDGLNALNVALAAKRSSIQRRELGV